MKGVDPPQSEHRDGKILVVGGYGRVGAHISTALASELGRAVIVAGRDRSEAHRAAQRLGRGVESRAFDLLGTTRVDDALRDVRLAIVCADQEDTRFLRACIERGVDYIDVTASDGFFREAEVLSGLAVERGVSVVLSVGVAPGLSNLLAERACSVIEGAERVDILLELGLGDHHGVAAIEWTLGRLGQSFETAEQTPSSVRSFGERAEMSFPGERPRWAYRFDVSDQHALHRTLGLDAATWLRLSSPLATAALGLAVRTGLARSLGREPVRSRVARAVSRVHLGSRQCAVAARAVGLAGASATCQVAGREEARMTAAVATAVGRQLLGGGLPLGVFHSHQGVDLDDVIRELEIAIPGLLASVPPKPQREQA